MGMKLSDLPDRIRAEAERQLGKAAEQPKKRRGAMNKYERQFGERLESMKLAGDLTWYAFEATRIRIGTGGGELRDAYYCPDFTAVDAAGRTLFYEVKGHRREAGIVRIKAAAMAMPYHQFILVESASYGGWKYTPIGKASPEE